MDDLEAQATADEKAGHARTAGQKYRRATNYLLHAERMQRGHAPERMALYQRCLDLLAKSIALADPATTRVEVPYAGTSLPAYFRDASSGGSGSGGGRTVPCVIMWNGLDSAKEHMYLSGFAEELAARGISTLMVDCPGSGEALRLRGMTARIDTEAWAAACVDYLLTRGDVDPARIGLAGWSLGGYYAPRAAAFEKRLALVVAWGANHDWGAVQRRRLEREGEHPVPHYWEHVLWVWGQQDLDTFIEFADAIRLDGVVEQITVQFLIIHGENDRQIPLAYAHRSHERTGRMSRRSAVPNGNCGSSPPARAARSTSARTTCRTSPPSSPTGSPTRSLSCRRRAADRGCRGQPASAPRNRPRNSSSLIAAASSGRSWIVPVLVLSLGWRSTNPPSSSFRQP